METPWTNQLSWSESCVVLWGFIALKTLYRPLGGQLVVGREGGWVRVDLGWSGLVKVTNSGSNRMTDKFLIESTVVHKVDADGAAGLNSASQIDAMGDQSGNMTPRDRPWANQRSLSLGGGGAGAGGPVPSGR